MYRKIMSIAIILAALLAMYEPTRADAAPVTDTVITVALSDGGYFASDEEMEKLLKAKDYVFKRQWENAIGRLEDYLNTYPKGRFVDEALYWLAQSLDKTSADETNPQKVIVLKEEAIHKLDTLLDQYPESSWHDDAETLKIEISGQLALMGKKEHERFIQEFLANKDKDLTDAKLAALKELAELSPEAAIPALETALRNEKDPSVRLKCVYLLANSFPDEALAILSSVEYTDPDQNVREEISKTLERIKVRLIPVQVNYYVYTGELDDRSELERIPENDLKSFDLPKIKSTNKKGVQKALEKFFHDELTNLQFAASSFGAGETFNFSVSHNVGGFNVSMLAEGYRKEYDQISGTVRFKDLDSEKTYKVPYNVDKNSEALLATRKGNKVALMVLQFESHEETDADRAEAEEPMYHHEHTNVLGCRVFSSRQSFSWDEMMLGTAMIDYGRAKVEFPGENGKMVLIGDILLNTKKRLFVGRRAELFDKTGTSIAKAAQIVVPVDKPSDYKVVGED